MQLVTVANKEYQCYWFTGKVLSAAKNLETKVHGSGGGGYSNQGSGYTAPVRISSTTTVHDQLFIVDKSGNERAFQLQGFNVACREGNEVSVVWAMRVGKDTGPYVYVANHTTKDDRFDVTLVAPNPLGCAAIVLAALFLPFMANFGGFITVILAFGAPLGWFFWARKKRMAEFKAAVMQLNLTG